MKELSIKELPFYFIRHGETDWNHSGLLMGRQDIDLNETGIKQARNASQQLCKLSITKIVSSPLKRAKKTAEIINEHLNVDLKFNIGLQECAFGALEGKSKYSNDVVDITKFDITNDNGENFLSFQDRVIYTLNSLLNCDDKLLIVAHAGTFWAILEALSIPYQKCANCEIFLFTPTESGWIIESV